MKYYPERLTFSWIRQAYASKEIEPAELIDEIIRRSEETKDKNIWIVPPSHEITDKYIKALPEDKKSLPLWGIPFAVKDNIDLENVPTTAACPEYSYIPEKNAFTVERLIAAGAIPVGKTNLDQFATGLVGTRSPYGEVHNAFDDELISGGSSSGSAVAAALGMAAFSLGTDTAGSGRIPAMLNALVGYKPPLGAWSTSGVVPACASLDCVTVFANTLDDAKEVDSVARGYDENCPWSKRYVDRGSSLAKKIYLPAEEPRFFGDYADVFRSKWNRAIERIKSLGIEFDYIDFNLFYEAALILYEGAYISERWEALGDFVEAHPGKLFPVTEKILRSGNTADKTASALFRDLHRLMDYRHKARELLKNDAVFIMPTAGGTFKREQVRNDPVNSNSLMGLYTNHCNLLDLAAIAVPEDSKDTCLPFGITIFGLSDSENILAETAKRFMESESVEFAVCGLHKKGYPLEWQLTALDAEYCGSAETIPEYRMFKLASKPAKPGLIRTYDDSGKSILIDIYRIPKTKLGIFLDDVRSPLTVGNIELTNGRIVKGFLCESYAVNNAEDITSKGVF